MGIAIHFYGDHDELCKAETTPTLTDQEMETETKEESASHTQEKIVRGRTWLPSSRLFERIGENFLQRKN